jgi:hypothetical protein
MGEWDDERACITGREIASNIPSKEVPVSERERKRLLKFVVIVPGAIAFAFLPPGCSEASPRHKNN